MVQVEKNKGGRPKINEGYTSIRVDLKTYTRFKRLAGEGKLSTYLREVSENLYESALAQHLIDAVVAGEVYRRNAEGKLVKVHPKKPPMPDLSDIEARIQAGEFERESQEHLNLLYERLSSASRGESYEEAIAREMEEEGKKTRKKRDRK